MESDLPLIEISGEDDSLLQQTPNADLSNYLRCSPLHVPRSGPSAGPSRISTNRGLKDNKKVEKPSCSLYKDRNDNENVGKVEATKLGMEPQNMKRRKKGGGYNLRKSLAWDRAFFTEEGILNPSELSMIGGTSVNSTGEVLSVIHEEGSTSDCSTNMQALQENLFEELLASTQAVGKKGGNNLLPKHDNSPVSTAKRKVLLAQCRSGSKRGGCPRPSATASQKRPANANTTKATTKDLNFPKIPLSKTNPGSLPMATRSATLGASYAKHNQIARAAVDAQKRVALKSSSNNIKSVKTNSKPDSEWKSLYSKSSVPHSRGNVASSTWEVHASTKLQTPQVPEHTGRLRVVADPATATGTCSSGGSNKHVVSLTQSAPDMGGNAPRKHQTAKASGLRMPTPSLRFFDQHKTSASHSLHQRNTQSCLLSGSNIPNLRKPDTSEQIHEVRTSNVPGKKSSVANCVTTENVGVLRQRTDFSVSSSVSHVSHEKNKSNVKVTELRKVEQEVPHYPKGCELTHNEQQLSCILDDAEKQFQESEESDRKVSNEEDLESQVNGDKLLLKTQTCDHLKDDLKVDTEVSPTSRSEFENPSVSQLKPAVSVKSVSIINYMTDHIDVKNKQYHSLVENQHIIYGSLSRDAISNRHGEMPVGYNTESNGLVSDASERYGEQADQSKPCTSNSNNFSHENQRLQKSDGMLHEECKVFENSPKYVSGNVVNVRSKGSRESEVERSRSLSPLNCMEQVSKDATGEDDGMRISHVGDTQTWATDLLDKSCDRNLCASAVVGQCLVAVENTNEQSGEHSQLQSPCLVVKHISQYNQGSGSQDNLLPGKISLEESQREGVSSRAVCVVTEKIAAAGSDLRCFDNDAQVRSAIHDDSIDVNKMSEHQKLEDSSSGFLDTCNCFINIESGHDTEPNGLVNFVEIDSTSQMSEDQTAVTTCNFKITKACSYSGGFGGSVSEDLPQDSTFVQVNGFSERNDMIECPKVEQNQCNSSVESYAVISEAPSADDVSCSNKDTSNVHTNRVSEQYGEQAKQNLCALLSDKVSHSRLHGPLTNECVTFKDSSRSFEESLVADSGKIADGVLHMKGSTGNVFESSLDPSHLEGSKQTIESAAGVDKMTDKLEVEVTQVQLDECPAVENFIGNLHSSVLCGEYLMAVDDVTLQSKEHPELQNPCHAVEQASVDNSEFCLNSYILPDKGTSDKLQEANVSVVPELSGTQEKEAAVALRTPALQESWTDLLDEVATNSYETNGSIHELQQKLDGVTYAGGDMDIAMPLENFGNEMKQCGHVIRPSLDAAPFSEEWLAAVEAAGEEILSQKSGAVQHSPPDKVAAEPGPWSPVKKKTNQGIGPFDCTKFTNNQPSNTH